MPSGNWRLWPELRLMVVIIEERGGREREREREGGRESVQ